MLVAGQETHTVYALQGNGIDRADTAGCNGSGWREDEMYTLNTIDRSAVVFPEIARSLCARADSSPCVDRGMNVVCYEGQNVCTDTDKAFTIQAGRSDDHHIPSIACFRQTGFGGMDEGVGPLRANGGDIGGGVRRASSLSVYDGRGNGHGDTSPTLTGDHENRITDYTSVIIERTNDES